jgi:uncharacterized membrane protein
LQFSFPTCTQCALSHHNLKEIVMSDDNVLIYALPAPSQSFQLLSELRNDSAVKQAAVVERTPQGEIRVDDRIDPQVGVPTLVGGAVGSLIGVLAGPVGLVLGWSAGALAGASIETGDASDDQDGLSVLARGIAPGSNVVIAEIEEASFGPADERAARYGGKIVRIPAAEVLAEVDSARVAASEAAATARKARRQKRETDFKAKVSGLFHTDSRPAHESN